VKSRELSIPGVTTRLLDKNNNEVPMTSQGLIGNRFAKGENACLKVRLEIDPGCYYLGIGINDTTADVFELEYEEVDGHKVYERNVRILESRDRVLYPDKENNIVRLIAVKTDGTCVMWNIALISQSGNFFLTFQTMFTGQAYADGDGKIRLPQAFESEHAKTWSKMGKFLEGRLTDFVKDNPDSGLVFPSLGTYVSKTNGHQPVDGEVKWYSLRKQMGCIHTRKGKDARVHFGQIKTKRPDGLLYLSKGEVVKYDLSAPRGMRPESRSTGFDYEAINVEVVAQ